MGELWTKSMKHIFLNVYLQKLCNFSNSSIFCWSISYTLYWVSMHSKRHKKETIWKPYETNWKGEINTTDKVMLKAEKLKRLQQIYDIFKKELKRICLDPCHYYMEILTKVYMTLVPSLHEVIWLLHHFTTS